jgi:hypothetical protein
MPYSWTAKDIALGWATAEKVHENYNFFNQFEGGTYKKPSIISRTGATNWLKTKFGPTGHRHLRSSPLPCICTVPSTSTIT